MSKPKQHYKLISDPGFEPAVEVYFRQEPVSEEQLRELMGPNTLDKINPVVKKSASNEQAKGEKT